MHSCILGAFIEHDLQSAKSIQFQYKRRYGYYSFLYPTKFLMSCLEYNSLKRRRAFDQLSMLFKVFQGIMTPPNWMMFCGASTFPISTVRAESTCALGPDITKLVEKGKLVEEGSFARRHVKESVLWHAAVQNSPER